MKKLGFLLLILVIGCSPKSESTQLYTTDNSGDNESYTATSPRFAAGDIAYLKPDSLRVVITDVLTSVYKGQRRTVHTYNYYFHTTSLDNGTFRKTGRKSEVYFY